MRLVVSCRFAIEIETRQQANAEARGLTRALVVCALQSFQVGAGTVWAFKNIVYLMMARPGNTMFACQRVDDDNLHRASVTLQTSRLYLMHIRVRSGPAAWLPDPRIDTVLI